jgi:hypothetical protein
LFSFEKEYYSNCIIECFPSGEIQEWLNESLDGDPGQHAVLVKKFVSRQWSYAKLVVSITSSEQVLKQFSSLAGQGGGRQQQQGHPGGGKKQQQQKQQPPKADGGSISNIVAAGITGHRLGQSKKPLASNNNQLVVPQPSRGGQDGRPAYYGQVSRCRDNQRNRLDGCAAWKAYTLEQRWKIIQEGLKHSRKLACYAMQGPGGAPPML